MRCWRDVGPVPWPGVVVTPGRVPRPTMRNMQPEREYPRRLRRLTLLQADHNSYFLTVCVEGRKPVLANDNVHGRLCDLVTESLDRYGVWVDSYVLMPDHVHFIVTVSRDAIRIGKWVKAMKAVVACREFQWQSGFFDHVLRSNESRSEKWEYIRMNPVRRGLVNRPEDWPFAAAFHQATGQIL